MKLNRLLKKLEDVIKVNIALYDEMVVALEVERESLKSHSLDGVSEAVKRKTEIAYKIKSLEIDRLNVLQLLSKETGVRQSQLSLKGLADVVSGELRLGLLTLRSRLRESVGKVTELNLFNRGLIDRLMSVNYGAASHLNHLLQPGSTYEKAGPVSSPFKPGQVLSREM